MCILRFDKLKSFGTERTDGAKAMEEHKQEGNHICCLAMKNKKVKMVGTEKAKQPMRLIKEERSSCSGRAKEEEAQ